MSPIKIVRSRYLYRVSVNWGKDLGDPRSLTGDPGELIGSNVYIALFQMALASPYCHRIYLTQVLADIKCDTFLPEFDANVFKKIE